MKSQINTFVQVNKRQGKNGKPKRKKRQKHEKQKRLLSFNKMQLNIIMKKKVFQKRNDLFVHIEKNAKHRNAKTQKNLFEEKQRQNKENWKRVLRTFNKQVFNLSWK